MLLFYTLKSWSPKALLCLMFFSCGGSQEFHINKLWKFLAVDKTHRAGLYYFVDNTSQLQLRLDNLSGRALIVNYRLRVFESRTKERFYETPAQRVSIPLKEHSTVYQSLSIELSQIKSVHSIEIIEFSVSDNSD